MDQVAVFFEAIKEATTLIANIPMMMSNEWVVVKPMISNQSCNNILAPIKTIKNAKPVSKYLNLSKTLTNKKNMERKPRIAKIFEKKTIYESRVTENMAGIISVSKMKVRQHIVIKNKNK